MDINYRKERGAVTSVSSETFSVLLTRFQKECDKGSEVVEFKRVSNYLQAKMNIVNNMSNVIFCKYALETNPLDSYAMIREYVNVKNTLFLGSIEHEG